MEGNPLQKETAVPANLDTVLAGQGATFIEKGETHADAGLDLMSFGELSPELEKAIGLAAVFAADYLKGPILTDKFGDEEIDPWERREWRAGLITEYGESMKDVLELNRMKPNRMMPFLSQAQRLEEKLQKCSARSLALQQLEVRIRATLAAFEPIEEFGARYIHLPLAERIEAAKTLSEGARDFLHLVEKPGYAEEAKAA